MESRRRNLLGLSDPIDDVKYDGLGTTDPASDLIDQASRSDGAGSVLAPATGPPEKASVVSTPPASQSRSRVILRRRKRDRAFCVFGLKNRLGLP